MTVIKRPNLETENSRFEAPAYSKHKNAELRDLATLGRVSRPRLRDMTVLIPTLGRPVLQESLYWLAIGSHWPERLLVIAQGMHTEVEIWMNLLRSKGLNAQCIKSSLRGRSLALNLGLESVRTRFFAITDDDCFVDSLWLETIGDFLIQNELAVVTGRVETLGNVEVNFGPSGLKPKVCDRVRVRPEVLSGGNMGASISVVRQIGPFDEDPRLVTAEDCDWAYRLVRAGNPIFYLPGALVHHLSWRRESERLGQYREYARSHGGFYAKHLRRGDLLIGLRVVIHHARALKRWILGILKQDKEQAAIGRAYFTGLIPGMLQRGDKSA